MTNRPTLTAFDPSPAAMSAMDALALLDVVIRAELMAHSPDPVVRADVAQRAWARIDHLAKTTPMTIFTAGQLVLQELQDERHHTRRA